MTPEEYSENLTRLHGLVSGDLAADTILISGAELLISIKQRITQEGRTTTDKTIGAYSTKPMYASKQLFIGGGFLPQGKTGKLIPTVQAKAAAELTIGHKFIPLLKQRKGIKRYSVVKNDNTPHKTMYLQGGYKELRDIQGLRTDIMNLYYRGDLINSYQMQKQAQSVLLGLTSEKEALKRHGLEDRFGNIFYASQEETEAYIKRTNFLLTRITRNTLSGYNVEAKIS